jgi:hypothetical protein
VRAVIIASCPAAFSAAQVSAVRRSCQTMALWIGSPVLRSQISVVSRWLVMPMAAMSRGADPGLLDHRTGRGRDGRPQIGRVMLDPARGGIMLGKFFLRGGDGDRRSSALPRIWVIIWVRQQDRAGARWCPGRRQMASRIWVMPTGTHSGPSDQRPAPPRRHAENPPPAKARARSKAQLPAGNTAPVWPARFPRDAGGW